MLTPKRVLIGWETIRREPVYWDATKNYYDEDDVVVIHDEEEYHELYDERDRFGRLKIEWAHSPETTIKLLSHDIDMSKDE